MDDENEINELHKRMDKMGSVLKEYYECSVRRKNAVNALNERIDDS